MELGDTHLKIRLARNRDDILGAQRLRYQVFVQEMGATGGRIDHKKQLETDDFDAFCQHLILVDTRHEPEKLDHVVGVYRMLDRTNALAAGGFYSQSEFDLAPLIESSRSILELGRSCVHPVHRNGSALYRLWHGLGDYVRAQKIDVLFGVASFSGVDPKQHSDVLCYLQENHLAPSEFRVRSLDPNTPGKSPDIDRAAIMGAMPALIKAYLRIGGYVGDGAFVDREFNTTDVCMVVDTQKMSSRARKIYGRAGNNL